MMNLVHHATNSRSNRGMGRKGVHHHMSITTSTNTNETCQLDCKYPIFCKNFNSMSIVKNGTEMEENDITNKSLKLIKVVSQY